MTPSLFGSHPLKNRLVRKSPSRSVSGQCVAEIGKALVCDALATHELALAVLDESQRPEAVVLGFEDEVVVIECGGLLYELEGFELG